MDERTKQILRDAWLGGYTSGELISVMDATARQQKRKPLGITSQAMIKFYMEGMDKRLALGLLKNPYPSI